MKFDEIEPPEGWIVHENYVEKMMGVAAAFRNEEYDTFIEVIEMGSGGLHKYKVELRKASGADTYTTMVDHRKVTTVEEIEKAIQELSKCS